MMKLPIKRYEYERSALLAGFIGMMRELSETDPNISDMHFQSKIKGYEIICLKSEIKIKIDIMIRGIFVPQLKIMKYENGVLVNTYTSKSYDDNSVVVQKILE